MFQNTYLKCGKTYGDKCNFDYECSSSCCYEKKCAINYYMPSDSSHIKEYIEIDILCLIFVFLIIFCFCYCVFKSNHDDKQKKKLNEMKINNNINK